MLEAKRLGAIEAAWKRLEGEFEVLRDLKDSVYPFFESDTFFLECVSVFLFSRLAILRIEGCLN